MSKGRTCLICDASTLSSRNRYEIFTDVSSFSDLKLVEIISSILNTALKVNTIYSSVICKKCFKTCSEIDELQDKLNELKQAVQESYEKTLRKQNESILEFNLDDEELNQNKIKENDLFEPLNKYNIFKKKTKKDILSEYKKKIKEDHQASTIVTVSLDEEVLKTKTEEIDDITVATLNEGDNVSKETDDDKLYDTLILSVDTDNVIGSDEDDDRVEEIEEDYDNEGDNEGDDDDELTLKLEEGGEGKRPLNIKRSRGRPKSKKKPKEEQLTAEMIIEKDPNSMIYKCLMCSSKDNISLNDIRSHMLDEHSIKIHMCDICGKGFLRRNLFRTHLDEHISTNVEAEYQCEICNRIFGNLKLFRVHKKVHQQSQRTLSCELCEKKFQSRNQLEIHLNTHTGVRDHDCPICQKTFASKYTFKAHMKVHTDRERPFTCTQCGRSFFTQQNLYQHERTHSGMKNYTCPECGKAFGTPRNLEVHLSTHTGNRPFICRLCGKAFARKAEVLDHERTHTGEKPYQCELCGARFSQRSNLLSHKRATHYNDKRYQCTDCDKAFKRRRLLDYHIKAAHTGERPFQCKLCNASFIYPEHFKKHSRIHTGEKPYQCEICNKAFNSRDNRNAHRFIHSEKKAYECIVCGIGFMRKPHLYAHMSVAGHQNDTIIINQPQVLGGPGGAVQTYEAMNDDEKLTSMTIVQDDSTTNLLPYTFVTPKHDIDDDNNDSNLSEVAVEQLIINENGAVEYKQSLDDVEMNDMGSEGTTTITAEVNGTVISNMVQDSTIFETDDGAVHLVQLRLPDEKGEIRDTWVNFVPSND